MRKPTLHPGSEAHVGALSSRRVRRRTSAPEQDYLSTVRMRIPDAYVCKSILFPMKSCLHELTGGTVTRPSWPEQLAKRPLDEHRQPVVRATSESGKRCRIEGVVTVKCCCAPAARASPSDARRTLTSMLFLRGIGAVIAHGSGSRPGVLLGGKEARQSAQ